VGCLCAQLIILGELPAGLTQVLFTRTRFVCCCPCKCGRKGAQWSACFAGSPFPNTIGALAMVLLIDFVLPSGRRAHQARRSYILKPSRLRECQECCSSSDGDIEATMMQNTLYPTQQVSEQQTLSVAGLPGLPGGCHSVHNNPHSIDHPVTRRVGKLDFLQTTRPACLVDDAKKG
jgi:hypothetical protein